MDEFDLDVGMQMEEMDTELEDTSSDLDALPEVELDFEIEESERKSFLENLEDTDLFVNNHPGEYHFQESEDGKRA